MQDIRKYTVTITGKVQIVGFRGFITDLCKRLRIPSIVYNSGPDELRLLCEAEKSSIDTLTSRIREYSLAEITDVNIEEGLRLPYPPYRAVLTIEEEIYDRLDDGVKVLQSIKQDTQLLSSIKQDTQLLSSIKQDTQLLSSIKQDTSRIDSRLERMDSKLGKLNKLDDISKTLKEISKKI